MPRFIETRAPFRWRIGLRAWPHVAAGVTLAAWLLAGCGVAGQGCGSIFGQPACTHGPSGAPGGISQDAAIAAARRVAPASSANPTVVWAAVEHDPFAQPGTSDVRLVWEVRLRGSFAAAPCPSGFLDTPPSAAATACLDAEGGLGVVLDYYSGAFIGWLH